MNRAVKPAAGELSVVRTVGLVAALMAVFAVAIAAVCGLAAVAGLALVNAGVVDSDDLASPSTVSAAIVAGSAVLALIVCAAVNYTLMAPLRRMTLAMNHLAAGDFSFRMQETGRFRLREVGQFAESYNVAAAELASTEMMRAGFISDFSHEFRTPISSLSGFAQLLRDDDLTPEERREYADIIVEESGRLAGLSERILLLSKMEAAAILPDVETVNVAEQIRRTVALLRGRMAEKGLVADVNLDACEVQGNADYLAQLWTNLLDNAIKFSPEGGRVSVALYGGRVGEGSAAARGEAVVWVSDEGPGMDDATKARVFDRFYQGDSSHASAGSGLGLALCKRIVELHGGAIEVQSSPGKGSVFEVRLPLPQPQQPPKANGAKGVRRGR